MRIGILTGGGDCPGLNAAIRAVTRRAIDAYKFDVLGIQNGWAGLIDGEVEPLTLYAVSGILPKGGTILGTSRTNPFKNQEDVQKVQDNIKKFGLDVLIPIGGEDTLTVAHKFNQMGIPAVGIPKTIDNDLSGTDFTIGFDTAVTIATDAIDRLHTTAESHHRVLVVEVMGRHTGWIAVITGMAGGADCILIPEVPFSISEVCDLLIKRYNRGKTFSIVVVAEGAKAKEQKELVTQTDTVDQFGHVTLGGEGQWVGKQIRERTELDTRVTMLGHIQRGGSPTPYDRVLATRFGVKAVDLVKEGKYGQMVSLQGNSIASVPIEEAVKETKCVDLELYDIAGVFFG